MTTDYECEDMSQMDEEEDRVRSALGPVLSSKPDTYRDTSFNKYELQQQDGKSYLDSSWGHGDMNFGKMDVVDHFNNDPKYNQLPNFQFQDAQAVDAQQKFVQQPVRPAKVEVPRVTGAWRRDQTFRALPGKTATEVVAAVEVVLRKYNKKNGQQTLSPFQRGDCIPKLEWDDSPMNTDKFCGKFMVEFCEDINATNAQINVYKYTNSNQQKEIWVEFTNIGGNREAYSTFFNIIYQELIDDESNTHVLQGLVCDDFYPLAAMDEMGDYSDYSDSEGEEMSDQERAEVRHIIRARLDLWKKERYYERLLDGMNELIGLVGAYPDIVLELWDDSFERCICKQYKKCGDLPLARSMLMCMEKIVGLCGANDRETPFIKDINKRGLLFRTVFATTNKWCKSGTYKESWIMQDQIFNTLRTFVDKGVRKNMGGGKQIPDSYMYDVMDKYGSVHKGFAEELRYIMSKNFQEKSHMQSQVKYSTTVMPRGRNNPAYSVPQY